MATRRGLPVVGCFIKILYKRALFSGSNIISCARQNKGAREGNLTRVFTHSAFTRRRAKERETAPKENTAAAAAAAVLVLVVVVVGGNDEFSEEPLWHANHI